MLKLTLTPNRDDRRRYVRLVRYVRTGDRVQPYLVFIDRTSASENPIDWRRIRQSPVDPAFERDWLRHVRESRQRRAKTTFEVAD